jgi:hypothetical protein
MTVLRTETRTGARLKLLLVCAVILGVPALAGRTALGKRPFDRDPLDDLKGSPPDYVLIGDSMLMSRIDPERLGRRTGGRVALLADHGSASARWYLFFKNYVVASGAKPRRVFVFFRDRYLTSPLYRTTGPYRRRLERAMHESEPVYERLVVRRREEKNVLERTVRRAWPIQDRQTAAAEDIASAVERWVAPRGREGELLEEVNGAFDLKNLRRDLPSDIAGASRSELTQEAFDPSPEKSFLPHLVALARENAIPICFVRVKRRPPRSESPAMKRYVADLSAWLAANGAEFHDEAGDPFLTAAMYADGDHLSEEAKGPYTDRFHDVLRGLFR